MHTRRSYLSACLAVLAWLAAPPASAQTEITDAGKLMKFESTGNLLMNGHCFGNVNPMPTAGVANFFNGAALSSSGNLFFSGAIAWNSTSFPGGVVVQSGATTIGSISSGNLYLKGKCTNTSGCSNTTWEPTKWTSDSVVQVASNCYNYGADKVSTTIPARPGRAHGIDIGSNITVSVVKSAIIADGFTFVSDAFPGNTYDCGTGHLVFMAVNEPWDYHFYRLDQTTGLWSHKLGETAPRQGDARNRYIANPLVADRGNYTQAGGFYCVCGNQVVIN